MSEQNEKAVAATLKAMQAIVEDEKTQPELRINAAKVIAALQRYSGRARRAGGLEASHAGGRSDDRPKRLRRT